MKLLESIGASAWISGMKPVTCTYGPCSRWLTQRYLDVRKAGVLMDGLWYCSYGCFRHAAEAQFARMLAAGSTGPSQATSMSLGLTLVSRGLLTMDQYKAASETQRETGEEIGDVISRLGLLHAKQIAAVRAAQWGCPIFTRTAARIETGIHIPPTLMQRSSMVPLHFAAGANKLLVGFVYCVEYGPLYAVEQILECTAQPCFITPEEHAEKMRRLTEQEGPKELRFDGPLRIAEMARILCDYGALVDADEIVMRRCREFLWARLKSREKATDLLFDVA